MNESFLVILIFVFNFFVYESSFTDVNTVQELTDILVLNKSSKMDSSSGVGNEFQVVTGDLNFVLLTCNFNNNTFSHVDLSDSLFTQEVSDFNILLVIRNLTVDWEMRIDKSHLVFVSLSNTNNHVLYMSSNSSDERAFLSVTVELLNDNLSEWSFFSWLFNKDIELNMLEVSGQCTSWTSNNNTSSLDGDGDTLWDLDCFLNVKIFHFLATIFDVFFFKNNFLFGRVSRYFTMKKFTC